MDRQKEAFIGEGDWERERAREERGERGREKPYLQQHGTVQKTLFDFSFKLISTKNRNMTCSTKMDTAIENYLVALTFFQEDSVQHIF